MLIGNGDAHAKNYSLLHLPSGVLTLSPLYDLMSTLHYNDRRLSMYIDSVQRIDRVTAARIANEGARWGMSRARAVGIIVDVLDRAPAALAAARAQTDGVPDSMMSTIDRQLEQLRSEG